MLLQHAPRRIKNICIEFGAETQPKLVELINEAKALGIRLQGASKEELDYRTENSPHQGILAECAPKECMSLADFRQQLAKKRKEGLQKESLNDPLVLALDAVSDPRNLGAIIRVAVAAGVAGILMPKHGSSSLTGVVDRASAGTLVMAPLVEVTNLTDAMNALKDDGLWWVGTAVAEEDKEETTQKVQNYTEVDYKGPIGLVLGSEGRGLRQRVQKNCDFWVTIPMNPQVESLNVSVATGILLFEVLRQREKRN